MMDQEIKYKILVISLCNSKNVVLEKELKGQRLILFCCGWLEVRNRQRTEKKKDNFIIKINYFV